MTQVWSEGLRGLARDLRSVDKRFVCGAGGAQLIGHRTTTIVVKMFRHTHAGKHAHRDTLYITIIGFMQREYLNLFSI